MRRSKQRGHGLASTVLLTESDEVRTRRAMTVPGMASWAGETPGERCVDCQHWARASWSAREAPCAKYRLMTGIKNGPKVPGTSPACRYFLMREKKKW